ncbi:invasion associated locus B family protein [Pseudooceanicola sp. CBS1P-1]|uniref:Invasion associated locus B family protein n=1 Tax=Pseudooceanicola albus TaxID=2692189 RepID=A0A6L7G8L8_9RHOB|nr:MULTISPECIES: invasion associated locus B family protein [Pseudooceanicola]MBT9384155.1 invasion associated locus B family protein [Pseudooceanicola endophyticus]MXN19746.1 hypothetical protein [Pseudooceanicola albus]
MTSRTLAAAAALALMAGGAHAQQESDNRVSVQTDWSVFEDSNPKECWAVSVPKKTVNTKGGKPVSVSRGEIQLMAFYRPGSNVSGQLAFTGGYPFEGGSTVKISVGNNSFDLYTEGEWAWPAGPGDDAKILAAMRGGAEAVLTGHSSRGTQTQDTFSLMGFTAALEEAGKRCK